MAHDHHHHDATSSALTRSADASADPGKTTRAARLPLQRKATTSPPVPAEAASVPTPSRAPVDDPFALHLTAGEPAAPIQRRADERSDADASPPVGDGAGAALPDPVRGRMEAAFSRDFSGVRVHEGPQAAAVGALAYTQGTDVHFRPGQYDPSSRTGQELIGHELAHVVQQSDGRVATTRQAKGVALNDDAALEQEADALGARAAAGEVAITGAATGGRPDASAGPRAPIQAKGAVIQRAVGFEMEVATWTSTKDEGKPLAKAEKIVKGDGFNLESDEVLGGAASDIEFVVHPPVHDRDRAAAVFDEIESLTSKMEKAGSKRKDRTFNAADVGSHRDDVTLKAHDDFSASMQVTVAVPLEQMPALFSKAITGNAIDSEVDMGVTNRVIEKNKHVFAEYGEKLGGQVSPQLRGLAALVVDYLHRGNMGGFEQFPKGLYPIMARTSFKKMFAMIPEAKYFATRPDEWADMMLKLAGLTDENAGDSEMMKPTFVGMEPGKHFKLGTTKNQWLKAMPDDDLLSASQDERFDGMGAIGKGTDKLVPKKVDDKLDDKKVDDKLDEKQNTTDTNNATSSKNDTIETKEDDRIGLVIEEVSDLLQSKIVDFVIEEKGRSENELSSLDQQLEGGDEESGGSNVDTKKEQVDESITIDRDSKSESKDLDQGTVSSEAAVFELRRLKRPGGPETWKTAGLAVFDEVDKINGGHQYEAKIPEEPKEDEKQEVKPKPRNAPFADVTPPPSPTKTKKKKRNPFASFAHFFSSKFSFDKKGYQKLDDSDEDS